MERFHFRYDQSHLYRVLFVLVVVVINSSCIINYDNNTIKGDRDFKAITRNVEAFDHLIVKGDFNVTLKKSDAPSIEIYTDANLHNYIYSEVSNNSLIISQPGNSKFKSLRSIDLIVHYQDINNIELVGDVEINTDQLLEFDSIQVSFIGATKAVMNLKGNYLSGTFPGSSDIELTGAVSKVDFNLPGASLLDASELIVNDFDLSLAGAGKADVFVKNNLSVNIAGAGMVNYKGNPDNVRSNIGGIGQLNNKGN